jgi:hypothetical protein
MQVSRLTDGKRKVMSIQEVTGMEGEIITMQEIFAFKQTGLADDGKVLGHHTPPASARASSNGCAISASTSAPPCSIRRGTDHGPAAAAVHRPDLRRRGAAGVGRVHRLEQRARPEAERIARRLRNAIGDSGSELAVSITKERTLAHDPGVQRLLARLPGIRSWTGCCCKRAQHERGAAGGADERLPADRLHPRRSLRLPWFGRCCWPARRLRCRC